MKIPDWKSKISNFPGWDVPPLPLGPSPEFNVDLLSLPIFMLTSQPKNVQIYFKRRGEGERNENEIFVRFNAKSTAFHNLLKHAKHLNWNSGLIWMLSLWYIWLLIIIQGHYLCQISFRTFLIFLLISCMSYISYITELNMMFIGG